MAAKKTASLCTASKHSFDAVHTNADWQAVAPRTALGATAIYQRSLATIRAIKNRVVFSGKEHAGKSPPFASDS
jgi:hypothetical protein